MPACLANRCPSKTGRKGQSPGIMLHKFPRDHMRIRSWLEHTGQNFQNLDSLIEMIHEGQKQNKYWLCSNHFTADCYMITPNGRVLKQDAIPSIFPPVEEGGSVIQESLKKRRQRVKKMPLESTWSAKVEVQSCDSSVDFFPEDNDSLPEYEIFKLGFCNIETQTDFTMCNSVISYCGQNQKPEAPSTETPVQSLLRPAVSIKTEPTENLMDTEGISSALRKRPNVKSEQFEKSELEPLGKLGRFSPSCSNHEVIKQEPECTENKLLVDVKVEDRSCDQNASSLKNSDISDTVSPPTPPMVLLYNVPAFPTLSPLQASAPPSCLWVLGSSVPQFPQVLGSQLGAPGMGSGFLPILQPKGPDSTH